MSSSLAHITPKTVIDHLGLKESYDFNSKYLARGISADIYRIFNGIMSCIGRSDWQLKTKELAKLIENAPVWQRFGEVDSVDIRTHALALDIMNILYYRENPTYYGLQFMQRGSSIADLMMRGAFNEIIEGSVDLSLPRVKELKMDMTEKFESLNLEILALAQHTTCSPVHTKMQAFSAIEVMRKFIDEQEVKVKALQENQVQAGRALDTLISSESTKFHEKHISIRQTTFANSDNRPANLEETKQYFDIGDASLDCLPVYAYASKTWTRSAYSLIYLVINIFKACIGSPTDWKIAHITLTHKIIHKLTKMDLEDKREGLNKLTPPLALARASRLSDYILDMLYQKESGKTSLPDIEIIPFDTLLEAASYGVDFPTSKSVKDSTDEQAIKYCLDEDLKEWKGKLRLIPETMKYKEGLHDFIVNKSFLIKTAQSKVLLAKESILTELAFKKFLKKYDLKGKTNLEKQNAINQKLTSECMDEILTDTLLRSSQRLKQLQPLEEKDGEELVASSSR